MDQALEVLQFGSACLQVQQKIEIGRNKDKYPKAWIFSISGDTLYVRSNDTDNNIEILSININTLRLKTGVSGIDFETVFKFRNRLLTSSERLIMIKKYFEDHYREFAYLSWN